MSTAGVTCFVRERAFKVNYGRGRVFLSTKSEAVEKERSNLLAA